MSNLAQTFLDQVFINARTLNEWENRSVSESTLKQIYDLAKLGPTSANNCPLRIVFIQGAKEKESLRQYLAPGNIDKTMTAPVTAIFAHDIKFYEQLPKLFPHADAASWFLADPNSIEEHAMLNGSLQAAYFMLAARACGLDCGPMSGFDRKGVQELYFSGTSYQVNFLCNLGYGRRDNLHPRLPRLDFEEACRVLS